VERSINRVTELQQLVQKFMRFLGDMNKIISHTVKRSKRVYRGFKKNHDFVDPGIKTASLLSTAIFILPRDNIDIIPGAS